jgi:hypothetical protein
MASQNKEELEMNGENFQYFSIMKILKEKIVEQNYHGKNIWSDLNENGIDSAIKCSMDLFKKIQFNTQICS